MTEKHEHPLHNTVQSSAVLSDCITRYTSGQVFATKAFMSYKCIHNVIIIDHIHWQGDGTYSSQYTIVCIGIINKIYKPVITEDINH